MPLRRCAIVGAVDGPGRWRGVLLTAVVLAGAACAQPGTTKVVVGPAAPATPTSATAPTGAPTTRTPITTTTLATPPTTAAPAPTTEPATTPATTTPAVDPAEAAWPRALDVLATIPVADERGAGYDADLFGYPARIRGDCTTRSVVLQRDSLTPAQVDPFGCTVVAGDWLSPYDGVRTSDPGEIEIDHVVALKEAWDSGAWSWDPAARVAFGNDVSDARTLRAVSRASNRAKGDRDPSNWLPREADVCRYLADWVAIKARWGLSMDRSEAGRIRNVLGSRCPDQRIAPFAPPPVPVAPATRVTEPATTAAPGPPDADVSYPNCAAARAAGAAPIHVGEPGYRPELDRDGDGVACE